MNDYDSLPSGTEAALGVVAERLRRQRSELDDHHAVLFGNGRPGVKSMVEKHEEWISRADLAAAERRSDARDLRRIVIGGILIQLAVVAGGLLWIGLRVAVGGTH